MGSKSISRWLGIFKRYEIRGWGWKHPHPARIHGNNCIEKLSQLKPAEEAKSSILNWKVCTETDSQSAFWVWFSGVGFIIRVIQTFVTFSTIIYRIAGPKETARRRHCLQFNKICIYLIFKKAENMRESRTKWQGVNKFKQSQIKLFCFRVGEIGKFLAEKYINQLLYLVLAFAAFSYELRKKIQSRSCKLVFFR